MKCEHCGVSVSHTGPTTGCPKCGCLYPDYMSPGCKGKKCGGANFLAFTRRSRLLA